MATNAEFIEQMEKVHAAVGQCTESVSILSGDVVKLKEAFTGSVDGKVKGINQQMAENTADIVTMQESDTNRKNITVAAIISAITAMGAAILGHFK